MKNRTIATAKTQPDPGWHKAIPQQRDRIQSELLVGAVGMTLAAKAALMIAQIAMNRAYGQGLMPRWFWTACAISVVFALTVRLLRSATTPAAIMGALICLNILMRQEFGGSWLRTAMPSLLALFLLTFAATRFGRSRKESMGAAEPRTGRRASQVVANLGVAGLLATGGTQGSIASTAMLAGCIAALAEATADTVSSEMGQALATTSLGRTLLITTARPVPPGTDGGVSIAGTALGAFTAAVIVLLSPFAHTPGPALCIFAAACFGLFFDSLLGATLEKRGWLGNDLVNFVSTLAAATLAASAIYLL